MDYLPDDSVNKNYVIAREDFYFVYRRDSTSTSASSGARSSTAACRWMR